MLGVDPDLPCDSTLPVCSLRGFVCVCLAVFVLDIRLPFGLTCCCAKSKLGLVYLIRSLSPSLKPRLLSPWTRRSESIRSLQGQKINCFHFKILKKQNYLSQEMWIFLPQRMQHFYRRVLLYRDFLIFGIPTAGEIIFVLKRQAQDFYPRNQFRSVSPILNVMLGLRLNQSVVGRLFTLRNFTVPIHHYLFSGIITYPLPRINCFSHSILRAWSKYLTGNIRLLLRLQCPSRHYLLNVRPLLNFLPLILGAYAKHQIAVTYAAI